MARVVKRRGRLIAIRTNGEEVRAYAPGDGHLSFVASYEGDARGCAPVTEKEANQVCPDGWQVYRDGPYFRARPATESE